MINMKYTTEIVEKITEDYKNGKTAKEIAAELSKELNDEVPERSVIAKLSSIGVYKRKEYVTKRGDTPVKKEEYIKRISDLLDINLDLLESLEKVTKSALVLMEKQIKEKLNTE